MSRARDLADGTFSGAFSADSPTLVVDDANNRVGVGTASPGDKLTLAGTAAYMLIDRSDGEAGVTFKYNSDNTKRADIAVQTNGDLRIKTNLTERLRILSTGGITFNGDTAAANALDDYEWGTFTPSVGGSTSDPSQVYQGRGGYYVKVGNLVHVNGWIDFYFTGTTAGSGNMELRGLPFTVINNVPSSRGAVHLAEQQAFSTANQGAPTAAFLENNGTTAYLQVYPNHTGKTGSVVAASAADIQNRSRFSFNCTYVTA